MFDPNSILGDPRHRQEQLLLEAAWRFQLVAPLLDPLKSASQRSELRSLLISQKHAHPWRGLVSVSARSLRRWCSAYREHKLKGPGPSSQARSRQFSPFARRGFGKGEAALCGGPAPLGGRDSQTVGRRTDGLGRVGSHHPWAPSPSRRIAPRRGGVGGLRKVQRRPSQSTLARRHFTRAASGLRRQRSHRQSCLLARRPLSLRLPSRSLFE